MTTSSPAAARLHTTLILLCVSVPSFMINLDSNIVAVSLSSIARSLQADFADIEWVISAYTLTFAALMMTAGALADRYGRKRILLIGLAVFTLASIACGAAPNAAVLDGARALQGVGAACQLSAAIATLSHMFRGRARARAFAFWGSVIGVAVMLGPIAGGFITQELSWRWAFYVNIPVGLVMIPLTLYAVQESRDPDAGRVDVVGVITFSSSLFLTTLALISGNRQGWTTPAILLEFVAAAVLFLIFLVAETRQERPMLDLGFFRQPTYIGANIASLGFAAALLTMLTYLPIYFQSGLGFLPQTAGLLMLPMAIPLFAVPRIVAGYLTHRLSGRTLLSIGLALVSAGMLWMGLEAERLKYMPMLGGMLVAGAGAGMLNGETAKTSMTVIPPERAGMASGVSGTIRFSGIVLGFATLGAILYVRIRFCIDAALPSMAAADRAGLTRRFAAGDFSSTPGLHDIGLQSFGSGYQSILFSAAALAMTAALLTWWLVSSDDTAPLRLEANPATSAIVQID